MTTTTLAPFSGWLSILVDFSWILFFSFTCNFYPRFEKFSFIILNFLICRKNKIALSLSWDNIAFLLLQRDYFWKHVLGEFKSWNWNKWQLSKWRMRTVTKTSQIRHGCLVLTHLIGIFRQTAKLKLYYNECTKNMYIIIVLIEEKKNENNNLITTYFFFYFDYFLFKLWLNKI